MRNRVSKNRWLVAQERERKGIESAEDIKEWLRVRRITWTNLVNLLKTEIAFDDSKSILEIGGGPTSVFLALKEGGRYTVDPMYKHLFELHPFMMEVEEYNDVNFIASPIERATFDQKFDIILTINALDHMGKLKAVVEKIDELLAPSGIFVIIVDCYGDLVVRNIIRFFDADVPHIHHFVFRDITELFSGYKLLRQDNQIFRILDEPPFRGKGVGIEVHRVDKFFARIRHDLRIWGKEGDIFFILRFLLCFSLALFIAVVRRQEKPIHPLKKARLFIFQKQDSV